VDWTRTDLENKDLHVLTLAQINDYQARFAAS